MASKPQERQDSGQLDRLLDRADRCLVRQLRVLSRTGRHPAEVKSAEAVFQIMLQTQEVMAQTHELLTKLKGGAELQPGLGAESHLASPPQPDADGSPKSHWNSDQEATWLLGSKKLRTD
jgi:hypothetical protein